MAGRRGGNSERDGSGRARRGDDDAGEQDRGPRAHGGDDDAGEQDGGPRAYGGHDAASERGSGPRARRRRYNGEGDQGRGERDQRGGERAAHWPGTGPDADPEAVARQICLRLLTAAPRTRAQLAAALRRRGVPADAAEAVLARFAEVKLIDDEMFARVWVESRHHGRGLAGRALSAELRQRGVASDDIQAALGVLGPDQELATARELVERRLASTAGMAPVARMRRLAGLLARKGYSPALTYRVVREALERESAGGSVPLFDLDELYEPADDEETAEM